MRITIEGKIKEKREFPPNAEKLAKNPNAGPAYMVTIMGMGFTEKCFVDAQFYSECGGEGDPIVAIGELEPAREGQGYVIVRNSLAVKQAPARRSAAA